MTKLLSIALLFFMATSIFAQTPDRSLYGNEPQFANNIILTIDAASIEANVRLMFNLLREQGFTATFFPNTCYLRQQDAALWQAIVANGFEIGYHTRNHTPYMTVEELQADFIQFQDEIRTILNNPNYTIRYVRPPEGVWDSNWMAWANSQNLITVRWNITSIATDLSYIQNVLQDRQTGGSIVLLHTGYNDVLWLENNLNQLTTPSQPYRITSISSGLSD